jgi:hypothetical protein
MANSSKIVSALHANWWINLAGLLISFGAGVVLVRAMPKALYAEYGAVLAMLSLAMLVFEAGANSGLTRYLNEAGQQQARGSFYRQMQIRRWLAGALCGAVLISLGPIYARSTHLAQHAGTPWLFILMAGIVAVSLTKLLAHYGLLALFETRSALLLQQFFLIARSVVLAAIALLGGTLLHLVTALLVIAGVEALMVHRRLWKIIGAEQEPIPSAFVNRSQFFGLVSVFDKFCAMLGSGPVILLVLASQQPALAIAFLTLAIDLVGKIVSLTVMPMGNLVAPYLSQTGDDAAAQGTAVARVVKLSSLLYCLCIGAGALLLPGFVPALYDSSYQSAAGLALLLLVPTALENWIRGCCSPALLRNGRYRDLLRVNVVQAVATVTTLALVCRQPVEVVLLCVGAVRCSVAAANLFLLRSLVPAGTYAVPLQGVVLAVASAALAWLSSSWLPGGGVPRALIQTTLFVLLFAAGVRWLIFRDQDTLHIAHRIAAGRLRFCARFLPARPALNA